MATIEVPATVVDWCGTRPSRSVRPKAGDGRTLRCVGRILRPERGAATGGRLASDTLRAISEEPEGPITLSAPAAELSWVLHQAIEKVALPELGTLANADPLPAEDMRVVLRGIEWAMESSERIYAEAVTEQESRDEREAA